MKTEEVLRTDGGPRSGPKNARLTLRGHQSYEDVGDRGTQRLWMYELKRQGFVDRRAKLSGL
jgi:hypothetical protein